MDKKILYLLLFILIWLSLTLGTSSHAQAEIQDINTYISSYRKFIFYGIGIIVWIIILIIFVCTLHSKRRYVEKILAEEKEILDVTLRSIGDGVITTDTSGKVVLINKIAEDITGWTQSEAVGRHLAEIFHIINEETRQTVESPVGNVIKRNKINKTSNDTILISKDGTERFIANTGAQIVDSKGEMLGTVLVFRDFTEKKRIVEEVKNIAKFPSENPSPVLRVKNDGTIMYSNPVGQFLLNEWDCLIGQCVPLHWKVLVEDAASSRQIKIEEIKYDNKVYLFVLTPVEGTDYVNIYGSDITERWKAEEELKRHHNHLEDLVKERTSEIVAINKKLIQEIEDRKKVEHELNEQRVLTIRSDHLRSLGEMATGIAHELNQPIAGVRAFAEHILLGIKRGWDLKDEKVLGKLENIVKQTERMTHIIEHIRLFAKEANKPKMQSVCVNEVVKSATGMICTQFESRGIMLKYDLMDGLPFVYANPFSLEEVFLNILINARDACEERLKEKPDSENPWILIRTSINEEGLGDHINIEIIDNGTGIRFHILSKVFEPFFTTKGASEKGTGLGLSISKAIVEQFKGKIDIISKPDNGTTISILLPVGET